MEVNDTQRQSPQVLQAKQRFGIVGNAPALVAAVERTLRVAPIDLSVLVTGESGVGKEFFPQIIHAYSPRKHAKYIAVNCGAIPEGTIDSELFGHEKGSFTGAVASRKGYFEEANGGTIFLDEVAELPLTTQARLLRVLETGEFIKVGSSVVQKTNIRVVAATNVDMLRAVEEGRFREDLYYRLSTVQISIPPLRNRGDDIRLLAKKFASDFASKWNRSEIKFDDQARAVLSRYRWPGNVRQLKNVIEQAAIFNAGQVITGDDIRSFLPDNATVMTPAVISDNDVSYKKEREMLLSMILRLQNRIDYLEEQINSSKTENEEHSVRHLSNMMPQRTQYGLQRLMYDRNIPEESPEEQNFIEYSEAIPQAAPSSLEDRERQAIVEALERNRGRRKEAAEELKISQRTLYRKIREYDIR